MNILFFTSKSPFSDQAFGGAESSIRLLAEQLNKKGHAITYFSKNRGVNLCPFIKQTKLDGINHIVFHPIIGLNTLNFLKELNNWFLKRNIAKIIRQYNIDIVYCFYDVEFLNIILNLRKQGLDIKIVMRMAGMRWYEECLKNPSLINIYEKIFNSIDCVNFIHSDLERMVFVRLHELGMNVVFKKSFVGDIGSSVSIGRELSYRDLNNPRFKIIMAARFSNYQKRQDILVKAISHINENIPLEVKLIGDGSERDRIQYMIKDLNLEHRISIQPFTEQNILWAELESADILCHACDYEGLGKIIIESMALGLPVLASNVAPLNKYIVDGKNGFLVNNLPLDWSDKIVSLYNNKEARIRVSENEILFVKEHYDPQKNVSQYENCFMQIIDS